MKKVFGLMIILVWSGISFTQNYQTAIGLKGTSVARGGGGLNVKHFIGGGVALDATIGGGTNSLRFDLLGEWHHATGITNGLDWYAGVGGMIGFWSSGVKVGGNDAVSGMYLIGQGVLGLDYTFSFPLNISFELGPNIGLINAGGFGFGGAFGIRYVLR